MTDHVTTDYSQSDAGFQKQVTAGAGRSLRRVEDTDHQLLPRLKLVYV